MDELGPTVDLGRITFNYPRVPNEKGDPEDEYDSSQYPLEPEGQPGNAHDQSNIATLNADFNRRFGGPASPTVTGPVYGNNDPLRLPNFVVTATRSSAPDFSDTLPTTVTIGDIAGASLQGAGNFVIGLGQGTIGLVTSTIDTIRHPINTARNTANGLGTLAGRVWYDRGGLASDLSATGRNIVNTPEGAQAFSRGTGMATAGVLSAIVTGRWGPRHGGDAHWQRMQQIANGMERRGWRDIRINRRQVDVDGNPVGWNRPDISGLNPRTGQRHNIEVDTRGRSSERHLDTLNRNDPNARNTGIVLQVEPIEP